jgi:spermidine synthase
MIAAVAHSPAGRAERDLFLISALVLYLEVACIRWFPAHVLFLTFFTNTVLLASFLGMSLGCLAVDRRWHLLAWTPALLFAAMLMAQLIAIASSPGADLVRVGVADNPHAVYFGTAFAAEDPTGFMIPIEVIEGVFFLMIALILSGPGQVLGRALIAVPERLTAYTLNIVGSLAGLALFSVCSWLELAPIWWFVPVVASLMYFLGGHHAVMPALARWHVLPALGLILAVSFWTSSPPTRWSPYYRIDYRDQPDRAITVNLIGHQSMVDRDGPTPAYAYAIPYLLNRDAGRPPFDDVLIVGAGSGNDVSRSLAWGARHIDAVEIDPVIYRLGRQHHPDQPYQDPRVSVHIDDGRNFLRTTARTYDLIVFALVDSLVLASSHSSLRLESFSFTDEALADVRARLKPGGVFVMYNLFRRGWVVARLHDGLARTFDHQPLVFTLPFVTTIAPESQGGFTILMAGDTSALRDKFDRHSSYWIEHGVPPSPASPDGFVVGPSRQPDRQWIRIGPAQVEAPGSLVPATDDWPFLYLRQPMLPALTLRGVAVMAAAAALLFFAFRPPRREALRVGSGWQMFFLGAGFMLIESKAVVEMALLFGSTWLVNSVAFGGILAMILAANASVAWLQPTRVAGWYVGLAAALILNVSIPLDTLLGLPRLWQVLSAGALNFAPIFFAGVIFALVFRRSCVPDRDFAANVAGAMTGGILENASMLIGFRYLTLLVGAMYLLSIARWHRRDHPLPSTGA